MKQVVLMYLLSAGGVLGGIFVEPFIAIAVYYFFAILRPQLLWRWALPQDVRWSLYLAVGAIVAVVVRLGSRSRRELAKSFSSSPYVYHWPVLVFVAWQYFSGVTAEDPALSQKVLTDFRNIIIMYVVTMIWVRKTDMVRLLYWIPTISLIILAADVNHKYFQWGRIDILNRGYGGLDNNGVGLFLAMGIPLCVFGWEASRRRWWQWTQLVGAVLILHAVLMTYSRGAMLSILAVGPVVFVRLRNRQVAIAAVIAAVILVPVLAGEEIRNEFLSIGEYKGDTSAQSRFDSWMAALRIAKEYPILGVGPRNSPEIIYRYGADMEGRAVHSVYLQLAADCGFVGLALYLAILLNVFLQIRALRRLGQEGKVPPEEISLVSGLEASLFTFCVGGVFLSLETLELQYLLFLCISQLAFLRGTRTARRETAKPVRTTEQVAPPAMADSSHPA